MNNIFGKAIVTPSDKRQPQFAGSWYQADAKKLRPELSGYLLDADNALKQNPCDQTFAGNKPVDGQILAAISPHAGYMFSGATAGYVFETLTRRKISRVFLLGPSHYVPLHGCALPSEKTFVTPLGDLKVDTQVIQALKGAPLFKVAPEIHKQEHSLEMQLPFIRQALGDVSIVPIIVGTLRDESEMRAVGHTLKQCLKDGDVVLVSSDFTHYGPRYDFAPFTSDTGRQVKTLDSEAFGNLHEIDLSGFVEFRNRTHATICGYYPCTVLLAMLPPGSHASLLKYDTSRSVAGSGEENFVSYMAVVFSNTSKSQNIWNSGANIVQQAPLTEQEKTALIALARESMTAHVNDGRSIRASEVETQFPRLKQPAGAFVTLYRRNQSNNSSHKELRGCIGYILPVKSLAQAVADNAIGASSSDPRFSPVVSSELAGLQIDINVLTAPEVIRDYREIKVGVDGVILQKNGRQAVFLPSVATEFGWTLEEMLSQLALKAGFGPDGWKNDTQFEIFQAESFSEE